MGFGSKGHPELTSGMWLNQSTDPVHSALIPRELGLDPPSTQHPGRPSWPAAARQVLHLVDGIPALCVVAQEVASQDDSGHVGGAALLPFVSKLPSHYVHQQLGAQQALSTASAQPQPRHQQHKPVEGRVLQGTRMEAASLWAGPSPRAAPHLSVSSVGTGCCGARSAKQWSSTINLPSSLTEPSTARTVPGEQGCQHLTQRDDSSGLPSALQEGSHRTLVLTPAAWDYCPQVGTGCPMSHPQPGAPHL